MAEGEQAAETGETLTKPAASTPKKVTAPQRREIPGNLPYLAGYGTLRNILKKAIELAKPEKFNYDFLENVVKITGGTARSCIPIMKKMGFLNSDNSTTELYGRFRTEGGRSAAAYEGLKNAFPEIFRRSDYAYTLDDAKLKDVILEITGLKSNDPIALAIKGTFNVVKEFIASGFNHEETAGFEQVVDNEASSYQNTGGSPQRENQVGLVYNINIVVPETSDIKILNAIFRAVKDNLL